MSAIFLTQLNVWLDVIFVSVWVILVFALVFHFLVGVPTGRFRKKFKEKQWPAHDWAPPALPKFMHFQHLSMMLILGFSGMYIRFPFFEGGREAMRWVHYVAMVIVIINLFWRLWYAFLSKQRDYKEFAVGKKDLQSMLGVVKYYTYMSNSKPHVAKYNVMQKMSYDGFLILMFVQALTGLALLTQPILFGTSFREVLVGWWLGPLVGGTAMAGAITRILHYSVNWLFIIMTTVHMYLAVAEDLPASLDFFAIKKLEIDPNAHAHHDDGHAHAPAAAYTVSEAD